MTKYHPIHRLEERVEAPMPQHTPWLSLDERQGMTVDEAVDAKMRRRYGYLDGLPKGAGPANLLFRLAEDLADDRRTYLAAHGRSRQVIQRMHELEHHRMIETLQDWGMLNDLLDQIEELRYELEE